ncbi:MAG: DUF6263 family protein [Bacillota bacterium]
MRFKKFGLLFLAFAFIFTGMTARGEDKLLLRLNLEKGKTYRVTITAETRAIQEVLGNKQIINRDLSMTFEYFIQDAAANGAYTVKTTYAAIKYKQDSPLGIIEYDSSVSQKDLPLAMRGLAALVGQSLTIKMTPRGKILNIQGLDTIFNRMAETLGTDVDGSATVENLQEEYGEEALQEMLENSMGFYPENPVGTGESWPSRGVVDKGFPMIIDSIFTVKERRDGTVYLGAVSTITPNPDAPSVRMGPLSFEYKLAGKQEGTLEVDESTGLIRRGKYIQSVSGDIQFHNSPMVPDGRTFPVSVNGEITVESAVLNI